MAKTDRRLVDMISVKPVHFQSVRLQYQQKLDELNRLEEIQVKSILATVNSQLENKLSDMYKDANNYVLGPLPTELIVEFSPQLSDTVLDKVDDTLHAIGYPTAWLLDEGRMELKIELFGE